MILVSQWRKSMLEFPMWIMLAILIPLSSIDLNQGVIPPVELLLLFALCISPIVP